MITKTIRKTDAIVIIVMYMYCRCSYHKQVYTVVTGVEVIISEHLRRRKAYGFGWSRN